MATIDLNAIDTNGFTEWALAELNSLTRERDHWQRKALTDPLTGVGNRAALYHHPVPTGAVVHLCDLDAFKQVNDTYGHAAGDTVIQRAAAWLGLFGDVYRIGGDEHVLITDRDMTIAIECWADPRYGTTMTVGTTRHDGDLTRSLTDADKAMYQSKTQGIR